MSDDIEARIGWATEDLTRLKASHSALQVVIFSLLGWAGGLAINIFNLIKEIKNHTFKIGVIPSWYQLFITLVLGLAFVFIFMAFLELVNAFRLFPNKEEDNFEKAMEQYCNQTFEKRLKSLVVHISEEKNLLLRKENGVKKATTYLVIATLLTIGVFFLIVTS